MRVLILLAVLMGVGGSAWSGELEYLLTSTSEYKHMQVPINRAVLLSHRQVVSEVVLQTIAMESANQSDEGMYLVAQVIVNRSRRSGNSLEQVVLKPKQFSCWNSPKWARQWCRSHLDEPTLERARNAIKRALWCQNRKFTALSHYHTTAIQPYWAKGHKAVIVVGAHKFYEGIR